jgi:putative DNA primase/helicase
LPDGCALRAHVGLEFWDEAKKRNAGRYPVLVAPVVDYDGERITAHVTYLEHGWKLDHKSCRKLLGPVRGRRSPAVHLMPLYGTTLAVAEGLETALAGHLLLGVSAWSCLNAVLLAKFEPPKGVERVVILADFDRAGVEASGELLRKILRETDCDAEIRTPPSGKDWADSLEAVKCN